MRPLSAAALLDVWERGHRLPPAHQALLLLDAACGDEPPEALVTLPVGRRDERLLTLREWTFGAQLSGAAACPACQEMLELDLPVEALRVVDEGGDRTLGELEQDGYRVRFRLPTGEDLVAVLAAGVEGPGELLARCVIQAERDGEAISPTQLPEAVVAAVGREMEAADPQARVTLALGCDACGHSWESPFDIVSFFWAEIERWAQRTMRDVHALASAYGWAEVEILEMSAWRRRAYLNLIRG